MSTPQGGLLTIAEGLLTEAWGLLMIVEGLLTEAWAEVFDPTSRPRRRDTPLRPGDGEDVIGEYQPQGGVHRDFHSWSYPPSAQQRVAPMAQRIGPPAGVEDAANLSQGAAELLWLCVLRIADACAGVASGAEEKLCDCKSLVVAIFSISRNGYRGD